MRASNSIIDGEKMFELKSTLERQEKTYVGSARRELLNEELSTDVAAHRTFCIKQFVISSPSEIRIRDSQI